MQQIVSFLVRHWEPILSGFLMFLSLIIALIRKKPAVKSLDNFVSYIVSMVLPQLIKKAEKSGLSGSDKKSQVLSSALRLLKSMITLDDYSYVVAKETFSLAIEEILSTPQKKE